MSVAKKGKQPHPTDLSQEPEPLSRPEDTLGERVKVQLLKKSAVKKKQGPRPRPSTNLFVLHTHGQQMWF